MTEQIAARAYAVGAGDVAVAVNRLERAAIVDKLDWWLQHVENNRALRPPGSMDNRIRSTLLIHASDELNEDFAAVLPPQTSAPATAIERWSRSGGIQSSNQVKGEEQALRVAETERRSVLLAPAAAFAGLMLGEAVVGIGLAPDTTISPDFVGVARLLTEKPRLAPELVQRAIEAIEAEKPDFRSRLAMLADRIRIARIGDAGALRDSPLARDTALMDTALELVRALYLGSVGKGWSGRPVSYEEALMFGPTRDVTVIPTYARGGPGNWTQPVPPEVAA